MRIKLLLPFILILASFGFAYGLENPVSALENHELSSKLIPSPRPYSVLLPPVYDKSGDPYPVLFFLHGGARSHKDLQIRYKPVLDQMWCQLELPAMVVVIVSAQRSQYLDYYDGSQKWEQFYIKEFIPHIRKSFNVVAGLKGTFIGGHSMGGLGSLRLAFKYSKMFNGVAAMAPGIMPSLSYKDIKPENKVMQPDSFMHARYGNPVNEKFWQENNPANIILNNYHKIKDSKLEIYIEVGNRDRLRLFEGTEFLHQILVDNNIEHEYRLVHKANHTGNTLAPRFANALDFIARMLESKDLSRDK